MMERRREKKGCLGLKTADTEREWKGEDRKGLGLCKNPNSNGSNFKGKPDFLGAGTREREPVTQSPTWSGREPEVGSDSHSRRVFSPSCAAPPGSRQD